jgi:prepilin-type N-terminal cleavage/methylation domain-containing protein
MDIRNKITINQTAFTLVEILVVIAVIGLLSSIIFAVTRGADEQGRIAKSLLFSQHLQNSLGSYAAGIWSFDEGSGTTVNDTSGWGNDGTINGATYTTDTSSGTGYSLSFNGVSSYIDAGNDNSLDVTVAVTLEIWVKPQSMPNNNQVIHKGDVELLHWDAVFEDISGKGFQWNLPGTTSGWWESRYNISYGNWYHIVFVYDSLTQKMMSYVNGVLTREGTISGTITTNASALIIAKDEGGARYNGLIDEVSIYATSLTSAQIKSQYYAGLERLLAKGQVTKQEYQQRLVSI